jgi:DNA-3-methyladenine glycosylase
VKHLTSVFFGRDPILCARELIGCRFGVGETAGIIIESEAYTAEGDPACHNWKRQGARDFVAGNDPGTAYVYLNYGMHWLFNFLVKGGAVDDKHGEARNGFVLIRALDPVAGIGLMQERRKRMAIGELCNGPAKLTQALGIDVAHHGSNPFSLEGWTLTSPEGTPEVHVSTRIGISQATDYPWRFLLKGCLGVSYRA